MDEADARDALRERVALTAHRARAWYWTAGAFSAAAILASILSDVQPDGQAPGLAVAAWLLIGFALGANGLTLLAQRRFRHAYRVYAAAMHRLS